MAHIPQIGQYRQHVTDYWYFRGLGGPRYPVPALLGQEHDLIALYHAARWLTNWRD